MTEGHKRKYGEPMVDYTARLDSRRISAFDDGDAVQFYELCNSLGYTPQGSAEMDLYERGELESPSSSNRTLESKTLKQSSPSNPPEPQRCTSGVKIYYQKPSEVVFVPRRTQIKGIVKSLLRDEGNLPETFDDWTIQGYYSAYFGLMGVEKYDPQKHN